MTRFMMVLCISGLSLVPVSAQVGSSVPSSPPKDLLAGKAASAASRARIVNHNEQSATSQRAIPTPVLNRVLSEAAVKGGLTPSTTAAARTNTMPAPVASLSQEYRVGVGDVLDVQLADMPTRKSTLFTVREGGALEYPLAGETVTVAGLTAEEIAARLCARIKVLENPKVIVKVRDYASHNVIITGLVADPGAKFLRREAIPLYVVLVEAQPRPEATSATITRAGRPLINVDLSDHNAMSTLILPGDLIKIVGQPRDAAGFFYAGGALNSPGQRVFHTGLTLTQAILASGGATRDAGNKAKVARQGTDGRLTTTEYNLRLIQDGKTADPVLQPGDRITVGENR